MTILEHLEALRRALIISGIAWLIGTAVGFVVRNQILHYLLSRADIHLAYYTGPTGGVMLGLEVAIFAGIFLSLPVIIWQAWWFVSPGLHLNERRLIGPLIVATLFFFLFGAGFALWSVPLIMNVLKSFAGSDLSYFPIGDQFLGFLLAVMVGYGLIFELPVVLYVLGRLRIISSGWLYKHRMYWLIGMAIAAQLLTPGTDPFTPFLMFIPLMIFWEVTTLLLKMTGR